MNCLLNWLYYITHSICWGIWKSQSPRNLAGRELKERRKRNGCSCDKCTHQEENGEVKPLEVPAVLGGELHHAQGSGEDLVSVMAFFSLPLSMYHKMRITLPFPFSALSSCKSKSVSQNIFFSRCHSSADTGKNSIMKTLNNCQWCVHICSS